MTKKTLTNTEIRLKQYIVDDINALNWLKSVRYHEDFGTPFSRYNIIEMEKLQEAGRLLLNADYFSSPEDVVDFYEKPWKFVDEANISAFYDHARYKLRNQSVPVAEKHSITRWLDDYVASQGFDFEEKIAEREDDLTLYE